jgi:endonuclease G, mitochondrial
MNIPLLLVALLSLAACTESPTGSHAQAIAKSTSPSNWGNCSAPVDLQLNPDGRTAQLLIDVSYTDSKGVVWLAQKGSIVGGASIPRAFWTVIGGPWEGRYRFASVIHDVACDEKKRPWDEAAEMFYEAMRCSGVRELKAKTMYYAVYKFGPQWPSPSLRGATRDITSPTRPKPRSAPTAEEVRRIKDFVARTNPTLEQIKADAVKTAP